MEESIVFSERSKEIIVKEATVFIKEHLSKNKGLVSKVYLHSDVIQTTAASLPDSEKEIMGSDKFKQFVGKLGTYFHQKMAFQVPINWEESSKFFIFIDIFVSICFSFSFENEKTIALPR